MLWKIVKGFIRKIENDKKRYALLVRNENKSNCADASSQFLQQKEQQQAENKQEKSKEAQKRIVEEEKKAEEGEKKAKEKELSSKSEKEKCKILEKQELLPTKSKVKNKSCFGGKSKEDQEEFETVPLDDDFSYNQHGFQHK